MRAKFGRHIYIIVTYMYHEWYDVSNHRFEWSQQPVQSDNKENINFSLSFCHGNPPVKCGFPSLMASNAEILSIPFARHLKWTIDRSHVGYNFCMRPASERRRYIVTSPLIGGAHTQNDPCLRQVYVFIVHILRIGKQWSSWILPVKLIVYPMARYTWPLNTTHKPNHVPRRINNINGRNIHVREACKSYL